MNIKFPAIPLFIALLYLQVIPANAAISLTDAIIQAQQNDPWLQGNQLQQQALQAKSVAAASLEDPRVSIGLMNLPMDSFSFGQEAMTQLTVGVSQMLPRGDSLAIKQSQLQLQAEQQPLLRIERKAQVATRVTQIWLDAYLAQKTIELINQDKTLFEQLLDIAKASYSSAVGKTRQQDVIQAQLEVIQLEDRLTVQQQKLESALAQLNEWFYPLGAQYNSPIFLDYGGHVTAVEDELPNIALTASSSFSEHNFSNEQVAQKIMAHPQLQVIDLKYQASRKNVELAKQKYKPQWGLNASYAYRQDAPNGADRADFFSIGVAFDVPLFTENRQDKEVTASYAQAEAIKTEKLLMLRQMLGQIDMEMRQLKRLSERQTLYAEQILSQTHELAEVSLTAYTHNDGDFTDVVKARIAELNARIAALQIDIDVLKTITRVNYYFVVASPATTTTLGD